MERILLTVNLILFVSFSVVKAENNGALPDGFMLGVSTSAYQTEGAWNEDGKGESIWDHWVHSKEFSVKNNDTGDIACDTYHKHKSDVELAASLGATHYRFSISWTRILPNGTDTAVNIKGVMYYQKLISEILERNMVPVATLYHYDLPQALQDLGGWTNPKMVDYFTSYARIAFLYFGEVQYWITLNEPGSICRLGYGKGTMAPGIKLDGTADYLCAYVVLKAHAAVYRLYKEKFSYLTGKMSIALDLEWSEPATDSEADVLAAERRNIFQFGLYANPIYKGNWPQVVIDRVGNRSKAENFTTSRLLEFTKEEINNINGTFDFMALNIFTAFYVEDIDEPEFGDPSFEKDIKAVLSENQTSVVGSNGNPIAPWGVRNTLNWLKNTYNDPDIFITENGVADYGASLEDTIRIDYYRGYLSAILDAIYEDKVKVIGHTAASLLDEFEWSDGYSQHFGFFSVDFTDSNRTRREKSSVSFYQELSKTRQIPIEATTATPTPTSNSPNTSPTGATDSTDSDHPTTPASANIIVSFYPLSTLLIISVCFLLP